MIINVQNKKDVITVDLRCKEIRYVHNIARRGRIQFYPMGHDETEAFEYLFNNNKHIFLEALTETANQNFEKVRADFSNLKILSNEEYLQLCN